MARGHLKCVNNDPKHTYHLKVQSNLKRLVIISVLIICWRQIRCKDTIIITYVDEISLEDKRTHYRLNAYYN